MRPRDLNALAAFTVIASERSFVRSAAKLGISQSALSHAVRGLEESVGVRLLNRTTRSVNVTDAGALLLQNIKPAFEQIEAGLSQLATSRLEATGRVRITTVQQGYDMILRPVLGMMGERFPNVEVEISIDDAFVDIVKSGFDCGLRLGRLVAKDMIALSLGPQVNVSVVGSPRYFEKFDFPTKPEDLIFHKCINYRQSTSGAIYKWQFEKESKSFEVAVSGPLAFNNGAAILDAAIDGRGIAYLFEDQTKTYVESGALFRILQEWSPILPGYHLYYPHRGLRKPAFSALLGCLKKFSEVVGNESAHL